MRWSWLLQFVSIGTVPFPTLNSLVVIARILLLSSPANAGDPVTTGLRVGHSPPIAGVLDAPLSRGMTPRNGNEPSETQHSVSPGRQHKDGSIAAVSK